MSEDHDVGAAYDAMLLLSAHVHQLVARGFSTEQIRSALMHLAAAAAVNDAVCRDDFCAQAGALYDVVSAALPKVAGSA